MDDQTTPSEATAQADQQESASEHRADRPPTSEEEQAAERARKDVDTEKVGESYQEMAKLGTEQKGEGRID